MGHENKEDESPDDAEPGPVNYCRDRVRFIVCHEENYFNVVTIYQMNFIGLKKIYFVVLSPRSK